ncbi:putative bifunctional diguanylate cyclase/phosphodiesterase [Couchioplanes azureus]|uniref:putative bifunctional diguanylate cyclase/phosphodiesterase n=1 Tax=Couchioplanes caeruleus TaxID=56438 RepID=UPI001670215F|nr:EAL domain-containing protein [Couchioplanes caeruleus]
MLDAIMIGEPVGRNATGPAVGDLSSRSHRRGSFATTFALAVVLLGLGGFTFYGNLLMTRTTVAQSEALGLDAHFSEARNAISVAELHTRQYQLEPLPSVRVRYVSASSTAREALQRAALSHSPEAREDARRLLGEHEVYSAAAEKLLDLVANADPDATRLDRAEVAPAFYTLQHDIDTVAHRYHDMAQRRVAELRQAQVRMLYAIAVGFVVGLLLVAVIWRLVLSFQRRLALQADSNEHLASHDSLTGLPNRMKFHRKLAETLRTAGSGSSPTAAVMMIDLNGFKAVNDSLGHQAGDDLLAEAGRRIQGALREYDMVARLGGDEFAVLLPRMPDLEVARQVAERIAAALREDFLLSAGPVAISGSIGIAMETEPVDGDDLLRCADAAMYRAKTTGSGVAVYDAETDTGTHDRDLLFDDLRTVIESGDPQGNLILHYQPQIRISDGAADGAEALLRWWHPQRGLLSPAAFLPLAEGTELETPLTRMVLDKATEQAQRWLEQGRALVVAVNVSARCLFDEGFATSVEAALKRNQLPAELLCLEFTDGAIMTRSQHAVEVLRSLHDLGVQVSVDDFGAGFSSMAHLRHLPATGLKIDRFFVRDLATQDDAALLRNPTELAHSLRLSVVAEGVEDVSVLAVLRDLGCDHAQGFGLARPVPAEELLAACEEAEQRARVGLTTILTNQEPPEGAAVSQATTEQPAVAG